MDRVETLSVLYVLDELIQQNFIATRINKIIIINDNNNFVTITDDVLDDNVSQKAP